MVRTIIAALIAFILFSLVAIWVISGGPRKAVTATKDAFTFDISLDSPNSFRLPWQPVELFPSIDLSTALVIGEDEDLTMQEKIMALEAEYDRLNLEASNSRSFGTPSPHAGKVTIASDSSGVRESDARDEYIQIAANYANQETIDIAGWTLESALSGVRVVIPPGASPFIANSANILGPIGLEPGALALVSTAISPIGVSFRENMCTGYLGQFQSFNPPLREECPSPSQMLPVTAENLQRYGDACFDAINNLSSCRFPQNIPAEVSGACRAYLTENLSYNGCIQQNRFRSGFQNDTWRVYLGASGDLWRNSHDAIRLLDASGRTVSVFVY